MKSEEDSVDGRKLQAWWWHRQGLDGSLQGKTAAEVLERCGWSRSVGGVGPYLTLFSRGGISREAADRAAAALEIHELPAARGCTYVLPAADFPLGLRVGQEFGDGERKTARKLGVTEKEIEKLCDAVLAAVEKEPLDPEGIRSATGKASRSLGEAGKKKGLATTLPLALDLLQARGEIRRVPVNGRLDQQRYRYVRWNPGPLVSYARNADQALTDLARRFFRWVGPATLSEFQWFSGHTVRAVREAVAPLALVPAEPGGERLLLPEDSEAFRAFRAPAKPHIALVSSLDPISANRRDVASLVEPPDLRRKLLVEGRSRTVGAVTDLPSHAILDRGRLLGFWEYDVGSSSVVWATFGGKEKGIEAKVAEMERFVREQLGDARSFSLDSPASRAPRIAALRKMS
jgi:hypothetical protein